jgi:hypothetical protein
MSQFILLLRGGDDEPYQNYTDDELHAVLERYRQWARELSESNQLVDAFKLKDDSRMMSKKHGQIQVDGPFTETKESIGGYYIVKADSYDAAIEIAKNCPIYDKDGYIEIREIAE